MLKEKGRFTKGYSIGLLYAIGRVGKTPASLSAVLQACYSANTGERIAAFWALGHIGSRERESPLPMSLLAPCLAKLVKHLTKEQLIGVVSNGVYALAEICDRRNPLADCVPERTAMTVGTYLESAEKNCRC